MVQAFRQLIQTILLGIYNPFDEPLEAMFGNDYKLFSIHQTYYLKVAQQHLDHTIGDFQIYTLNSHVDRTSLMHFSFLNIP
ncbi:hypothetical protein [Liquorilactobacillus ghanensis]|uniref:hypothetical protein n=1 Tax=Liquorilactobacillus ghanensis TaxID=399370 RepID=UPI0012ED660B|nr:hypothetical protein [Liquorilactobacillus ghanensis]